LLSVTVKLSTTMSTFTRNTVLGRSCAFPAPPNNAAAPSIAVAYRFTIPPGY
jgi:hypothetical protein